MLNSMEKRQGIIITKGRRGEAKSEIRSKFVSTLHENVSSKLIDLIFTDIILQDNMIL